MSSQIQSEHSAGGKYIPRVPPIGTTPFARMNHSPIAGVIAFTRSEVGSAW